MNRRVVITGVGIYSTIGKNIEEVKESLYTRENRVLGSIPGALILDSDRLSPGFWNDLHLKGLLPRRMRVGMAEQGEYAYVATMEALEQAKVQMDYLEANEVGILYGNDSSAVPVIEAIDIVREKKDTTLIGSGSIFQSMNSTITMNLAVILKLRGINFTLSAACASSSHAIGMAHLMISQGLQDMIICGGGQEVNAESMGSFDGLSAFSMRMDNPQAASRPFDRDRDGLVPSGGAATLILEEPGVGTGKRSKYSGRDQGLWLLLQWRPHFCPQC